MRTRNNEAARLESDYLARVRSALTGNAPSETDEIIQSIQEHIEEELTEKAPDEVSLSQMAAVLERLGPPEAYAQALREPAEAPPSPPTGGLDIGGCWNDAIEVYKRNIGRLIVMSVLMMVLSVGTLFILTGPLAGGIAYAMLLAIRRPSKMVDIGEMFLGLRKFWVLLGLFFIQIIPIMAGISLLLLPGVLLCTVWLYTNLLPMDQDEGILGTFRRSYAIARANGFWMSFAIAAIVIAIGMIPSAIPRVGILISLVISPLSWLLVSAAYNRCRVDVTWPPTEPAPA